MRSGDIGLNLYASRLYYSIVLSSAFYGKDKTTDITSYHKVIIR